jgi:hypothetical protein
MQETSDSRTICPQRFWVAELGLEVPMTIHLPNVTCWLNPTPTQFTYRPDFDCQLGVDFEMWRFKYDIYH